MRSFRNRWALLAISLSLPLVSRDVTPCHATEPAGAIKQSSGLKDLLSREAQGQVVQRRDQLKTRPTDDWSAWQAGYLQVNNSWRGIEELNADQQDREYMAQRANIASQPDAHWQLARWCREHGRPVAARAHALAYLINHPEHQESHVIAGHVLAGGVWVDKSDLEQAQREFRRDIAAIESWSPKLKSIFEDLRSNNANRVKRALDRLDAIDTVAALPALSLAAAHTDHDLALPLVRKIVQVRSVDACQALAQIAVENTNVEVHRQALKALKTYPLEFYVPQLLSTLATEKTIEQRQYVQPGGVIARTVVIKQELQNKSIERTLNQSVSVLSSFVAEKGMSTSLSEHGKEAIWSIAQKIPKSNPIKTDREIDRTTLPVSARASAAVQYVSPELAVATVKASEEVSQRERLAVEQANREMAEGCKPVFALLRETTGQELDNDARLWWDWWGTTNERYRPLKPVDKAYAYQQLQLAERTYNVTHDTYNIQREVPYILVQHSCLVAGTPVQTSTGLVPVEKIEVGDLVPCQNVETGELSMQPVVLTTIREPVTTIKIVMQDSSIQATGGHLWWVSGKGWTKTRDLKPGMALHSAEGSVPVKETVAVDQPEATYNLIVDKNHTYFVGQQHILSYDNSPVQPTTKVLPGYE